MRRITPAICIIALILLFASYSNDKSRGGENHPDDTDTAINVKGNTANSPDSSDSNGNSSTSVRDSSTVTQGAVNDIDAVYTNSSDIPQFILTT